MSTENNNEFQNVMTEIAANGDVILVVGANHRRLRIRSSSLINVSDHFRAMFGPDFSEGQDLSADRPKEVPWPDDDADAVEVICNVIHHRNDAVPETLDPAKVFKIAVASDKCLCVVAMKHASTRLLEPTETMDISGLGQLMAAAYLLDNPRAFSEITLAMLFRHKGSYLELAEPDLGLVDFIPMRIFCLLEERRGQMRLEIQQMLFEGTTAAGTVDNSQCSCGYLSRHSFAYVQLLEKEGLQPSKMISTSLSQVLDKLERMTDPIVPHTEWTQCSYRWHADHSYTGKRWWWLKGFKNANGLCIDCIRVKETGEKRNCRIEHEQDIFV
ncbi:Nn.00g061360.m01.CDS01 [Neocucurbitaria sp. VM-36]